MMTRNILLLAAWIAVAPRAAEAVECVTTVAPGGIPGAVLVSVANDSTASATFCGGDAGYSSDISLSSPSIVYIGTGNVTAEGTVVDLGMFFAGDELIFSAYVQNTGYTYYTGPGSRNPDGIVHAAVTDLGNGEFHIGFEDLFGGGDLDYNDVNIVVVTEGIDIPDDDADDDGIPDDEDNCVYTANNDQSDLDSDGAGDVCDECPYDAAGDSDGDGSCDTDDLCLGDDSSGDTDADGVCDDSDICPYDAANDADEDGVCESDDNCPDVANDQSDGDQDGIGDACDECLNGVGADADHDGVCDAEDVCANTVLPERVPTRFLGVNRWADVDGDGVFDTVLPTGTGPTRAYTLEDTAGCSCTQIIRRLGLGSGHVYYGCSISAMDDWIAGL